MELWFLKTITIFNDLKLDIGFIFDFSIIKPDFYSFVKTREEIVMIFSIGWKFNQLLRIVTRFSKQQIFILQYLNFMNLLSAISHLYPVHHKSKHSSFLALSFNLKYVLYS